MKEYDHMLMNIHRPMFLAVGSAQEVTHLLPCFGVEIIRAGSTLFFFPLKLRVLSYCI
jgi:hypothetical protein